MARKGKSLQDLVNQRQRLGDYSGRNHYWTFAREKKISNIFSQYSRNMGKLGGYLAPNKKFSRNWYMGLSNG